MAAERDPEGPAEQVARLYEQAETQAAEASERLVGSGGFASLLGQLAENAAAVTKLGNDWMDLVLRNLRLASRRDLVRLSRQLGRTEDKLERVLQELEEVQDQLSQGEANSSPSGRGARPSPAGKTDETGAEEQRPPP
jgi:ABC-type transporter Mla subunit MlaD